jgi:hypothetical protein
LKFKGPGVDAFGVVAPTAGQGTSFEKNRGTDARSVMCGKTPDIKDDPFQSLRLYKLIKLTRNIKTRNKQDSFPCVSGCGEKKKGGDLNHPALVQAFTITVIQGIMIARVTAH